MKKIITAVIVIVLVLGMLCVPANAAEGVTALSTDIAFECNTVPMNIETYNISNFGFYKLRDIAAMCDGTGKEFSVDWDGEKGLITLITGGDYTVSEDDLQPGGGQTQTAYVSSAVVIVNGEETEFTAYNINGYTYYKLRELCSALNIYVSWNEETRVSGIDTTKNADGTETSEIIYEGVSVPYDPFYGDDEFTPEDFQKVIEDPVLGPTTPEKAYALISYMYDNKIESINDTFTFPEGIKTGQIRNHLQNIFDMAIYEHDEEHHHISLSFDGFRWSWSYIPVDGYVYECDFVLTIVTEEGMTFEQTFKEIEIFESKCKEIIDGLFASGELDEEMSNCEKAKVLYEYIDYRFEYDSEYRGTRPYIAISTNHAVCAGYTATYNYLLELIGIDVQAQFGFANGDDHVWTRVDENGEIYYIDVTWGDPIPNRPNYSNPAYFWITYEEMMELDPERRFDNYIWED